MSTYRSTTIPSDGGRPPVQTPGTELFYAFLGLGSNINLGALAETAAIVPMAALIIVAAYRYAVSLFDDAAGGAAALLLFLTTILLRERPLTT